MALVAQLVDVPFEGGLDTNREAKRVIPGKLLELENARFRGGVIDFRPGSSVLGNGVVGGGTLTEANALASVGSELLRWTSAGVYGRAAATSAPWVLRSSAVDANPLSFSLTPAEARPRSCECYDFASVNGVGVYVWTEARASGRAVLASVVDLATGTRFQESTVLATESNSLPRAASVRVVACGATLLVFYAVLNGATSTAPILVRTLTATAPSAFSSALTVVSNMAVDSPSSYKFSFDAVDVTDNRFTGALLAYTHATNAEEVRLVYVSTAGVLATPSYAEATGGVKDIALGDGISNLRVFHATAGHYVVATTVVSEEARLLYVQEDLDDYTAGLLGTLAGGFLRVTAVELTGGNFQAWLEPSPGTFASDPRLLTATWDALGGVTLTASTWRYGVRLGGDAFTLGTRRLVPLLYTDPTAEVDGLPQPGVQPTFFLAETNGQVVLRALSGETGGPLTATRLCSASSWSGGTVASFLVPRRLKVEFSQADGALTDITVAGLSRLEVTAASPAAMGRVEEDGALHMGGACPAYYDGAQWVEDGFHLFPEGVAVTQNSGSGPLSAGRYSWCVCYEWTDALGRLHRSAPSIPVSYTFGSSSKAALLTVPYLHLTQKQGVRLAVYRTTESGSVFYRTAPSSLALLQPNAGTASSWAVSLVDDVADADISTNEVLYSTGPDGSTQGGELWHKPPPAYSAIFRHQDYLFTNRMEAPHAFSYSLPVLAGEGTAWADELAYTVPPDGGALAAFGAVDEKLILLASNACFAMFGEGPTRDGQSNGFSEPQRLTGSQGCVSARSVVSTVDGLFFQASTGFHLLTRSLETVPAGAAVDAYASLTVARALEVPGAKEVRFYTENGTTLVWNYEWKQWGTWTLQPAKDACLLGGAAHFAASGSVRYEDASTFKEAGQTLRAVIGTAWLRWASFKGLQRVWRLFLEGEAVPAVRLKVEVFVDDKPAVVESVEQVLLGSGEAGGEPTFSVSHHLTRQLCKALRLRFTLTREPVDEGLEGSDARVSLTALSLEFGVHPQAAKRDMRKV